MNKLTTLSLALVTVLWLNGCNQSKTEISQANDSSESNNTVNSSEPTPQPNLGIAIIDLDEIARQLGSDQQIVSAIKQREAALKNKLSEIAKSYNEELNKQKQALESNGDPEEGTVKLATYQQQVNQNFQSVRSQAQQNLDQHRSQLIKKFREAVLPMARKVADSRGLAVIITKQENLLYHYDPRCDITDEVVQGLQSSVASKTTQTASDEK